MIGSFIAPGLAPLAVCLAVACPPVDLKQAEMKRQLSPTPLLAVRVPAYEIKGSGLHEALQSLAMVEIQALSQSPDIVEYEDIGTGFLVSPCLMVTARHVVAPALDKTDGGKVRIKVHFGLGMAEAASPSTFTSTATLVAYGGQNNESRGVVFDDWAVLELDTAATFRPLDVHSGSSSGFRKARLALAGFPADLHDKNQPKLWVDTHCGVKDILINRVISTTCAATSGNSGAPLMAEMEGEWRAVAMLVRADAQPAGSALNGKGQNFSIPLDAYLRAKLDKLKREHATCGSAPPVQTNEAASDQAPSST